MTAMSRSARNRAAHAARISQTVPSGTVQPRRMHNSPHDLNHAVSIRSVGYLGRNPTKIRYAGSGTAGYKSEWAGETDLFTDSRWSQTVNNRDV